LGTRANSYFVAGAVAVEATGLVAFFAFLTFLAFFVALALEAVDALVALDAVDGEVVDGAVPSAKATPSERIAMDTRVTRTFFMISPKYLFYRLVSR
jgi:hypothetical protein